MPVTPQRSYAQSVRYSVLGAGSFGFMLVVGALIVVFSGQLLVWIVIGGPLAGFTYYFWKVAQQKAHETDTGLVYPTGVGWKEMPWQEISRFESASMLCISRVDAHMTDGRSETVLGLDGNRPLRWNGGEASDPIAELNRRLSEWHASAQQGPDVPPPAIRS